METRKVEYEFVDAQPGFGCRVCGKQEETRLGVCFDCASSGEERAAKRKPWQHFIQGWKEVQRGDYFGAKCCFKWAWERLTRTGDYAKNGTFDWEGYDWR